MLETIEYTAVAYFEHLKRRWRDENDAERLKKRDVVSKQSRRDQRTRMVSQIMSECPQLLTTCTVT